MIFREGDRFGRYIIGPPLGRGGMGEVRRAEDTRLGRTVALKILLHDDAWGEGAPPSPEAIARLMREARAAAALDHPNAVAIFDVGEEGDHPYIAMELIDGVTLRTLIGDEAQPLDRRIRWSLEVARALAAAHRRGIVHRDLKPENVMVREDGVVKVLDFGIARSAPLAAEGAAVKGAPLLPTLTEKGISVGTPLYMAPEQLRGEPVDPRADQFTWGVVAYELLTGVSPWASEGGPLQAVSNILTRSPAPMRATHPAIPAEVDDVVRRALAKDAGDRFPSMDAVVRALEPHAGVATERRAATMPPQRVRRRRRSVVVGMALALAAALAVGLFIRRARLARATASRAATAALENASAPVATTEHGSALSANAEANAEYRAGMQELHDASTQEATRRRFRRAIALDASFAAAHLGVIIATFDVDDEARDAFRRAETLRASLGERDRALLNAFEPWMRDVPNLHEVDARLTAMRQRDPGDMEVLVQLGRVRTLQLDYVRALEPLDAALRIDPDLPAALAVRATAFELLDRVDDAMRDYSRCVGVAPNATECLRRVLTLQLNEGKCAEAETSARRMISVNPSESKSYAYLAFALHGEGKPLESVRLALDAQVERTPWKAITAASIRFRMAVLEGRFVEASSAIAAWEDILRNDQNDASHANLLGERARLLFEIGRPREAAALARDYLKRRAGWTRTPDDFDTSIVADTIRYRAGDMPREAFARARESWRAKAWSQFDLETHPEGRFAAWFDAYAPIATTAEDAKDAVTALARFGPLPGAFQRDVELDEALGRTLLRAGQTAEALAPLRRAAASCLASAKPFAHTQALGELGEALETLGDRSAACRAYEAVLARWGDASPRSITAERARGRARGLSCRGR